MAGIHLTDGEFFHHLSRGIERGVMVAIDRDDFAADVAANHEFAT